MISLLPPMHIAILERSRILSGLDELFTAAYDRAAAQGRPGRETDRQQNRGEEERVRAHLAAQAGTE